MKVHFRRAKIIEVSETCDGNLNLEILNLETQHQWEVRYTPKSNIELQQLVVGIRIQLKGKVGKPTADEQEYYINATTINISENGET